MGTVAEFLGDFMFLDSGSYVFDGSDEMYSEFLRLDVPQRFDWIEYDIIRKGKYKGSEHWIYPHPSTWPKEQGVYPVFCSMVYDAKLRNYDIRQITTAIPDVLNGVKVYRPKQLRDLQLMAFTTFYPARTQRQRSLPAPKRWTGILG